SPSAGAPRSEAILPPSASAASALLDSRSSRVSPTEAQPSASGWVSLTLASFGQRATGHGPPAPCDSAVWLRHYPKPIPDGVGRPGVHRRAVGDRPTAPPGHGGQIGGQVDRSRGTGMRPEFHPAARLEKKCTTSASRCTTT